VVAAAAAVVGAVAVVGVAAAAVAGELWQGRKREREIGGQDSNS
jgi:hypothetical protein